MKRGPETDVAQIAQRRTNIDGHRRAAARDPGFGRRCRRAAPCRSARAAIPRLNGVAVPGGSATTLPPDDFDARDATTLPHVTRTREWRRDGRPVVRLVEIEWLGHAWSGGDPTLPFNDAAPPDATAMIGDWLDTLSR